MAKRYLIGSLIGLAGTTIAAAAFAADMPGLFPQSSYEEAEPAPQFEFGSGWYLRGDLTASDETQAKVLGTLGHSKDDWGYGVGLGAGYQFNQYFRADLTGDYLSTQKQVAEDDPIPGATAKANLRRWDGLVNGYFDLGTWSGLTPYIGAGIGFASLRTDGSYYNVTDSAYQKLSGRNQYNLAWAAMAGVAYHVTPNLLLDIGYRYLDLGSYRAPNIALSPFSGTKTDMTAHEVRVGVRYMLY